MERIYCITGLGADHRFFNKLSISNYELVPVHWAPYEKQDSVSTYAQKLAMQIKEENPIILGLSFGGMLAVEIAKQQKVKKVVIVSSAKIAAELNMPGGFLSRWIIRSGIVPARFLTIPNRVSLIYLGAKTGQERELIRDVVRRSDGSFMKWALKALVYWRNTSVPGNVVHIHGTADRVIPSAKVHPDHWIEGGTHIMIYNRAEEVSKVISDCLSS